MQMQVLDSTEFLMAVIFHPRHDSLCDHLGQPGINIYLNASRSSKRSLVKFFVDIDNIVVAC